MREKQTKVKSLVETSTQLGIGFFVSMAVWNWVVGPLFGAGSNLQQSFWVTLMFTISSFIRHYIVRRGFERWG